MSKADPNLKYRIGADTKDFDRGVADVKQGLKDLDKTNNEVLSSLGNAFGVNTAKIEQMTSSVRGLGQQLSQSTNTGVAGFGKLLKSITPLGGAIAGLGLGVAVAGFQALRGEADNFKTTIDGLNLSMATSAYIDTYKQYMHDAVSETGKSMAEAESEFNKWWARAGANLSNFLVNASQELKKVSAGGLGLNLNPLDSGALGAFRALGRAYDQTAEFAREADEAAKRNEERGSALADIEKEQIELNKEIRKLNADITNYQMIATDASASMVERSQAQVALEAAINERAAKQTDLIQRRVTLTKAMNDEASDTVEETRAQADLEATLYEIDQQRDQALRSANRLRNQIASATSKERAELEASLQAMKEMQASQAALSALTPLLSAAPINDLSGALRVTVPTTLIQPSEKEKDIYRSTLNAYFERAGVAVHVGFEADTERLYDITSEVNGLLNDLAGEAGNALGTLAGDLLSGGDAWGNFKSSALGAMGDMAQSVGKIAVSTGIASLGIKAALESLNGAVAIAAGTALIALGAAVKAGLGNVAAGNYSANTNVASGSYSSGNTDYVGRETNIRVSGELRADGNQLIAVIGNANRRNYYTTGG